MSFGSKIFDKRHAVAGFVLARTHLAASQFWPNEMLEEYQYLRLLTLLNHCGKNVPYYRRLFAESGFVPERDFKDPSDLRKVPVLTKDKARSFSSDLQATNIRSGWIMERTSGSTGTPFEVRISSDQIAFEKASVWRHWHWAGYRFHKRMAIVRTYVPKAGEPLIVDDKMRNFRYYSAYHLDESHALEYLKDIRDSQARFLRGYPSSLYILADHKEQAGFDMQDFKAILTASETLTAYQRENIERAFNSKIFDWYGLAEQVVTANECESHSGLHLNSEYGFWEFEKRDYLSPDERMIVGTNFRNYAMPLLRYETGDIATVRDGTRCRCGRTLPVLKGIAGRKDDIITTPEGARLPAVNFYSLFKDIRTVEKFQIIQWNLTEAEVRIKSASLPPDDRERIMHELRLRLGNQMRIKLSLNNEFAVNPQGKRRPVMSMVKCEGQS